MSQQSVLRGTSSIEGNRDLAGRRAGVSPSLGVQINGSLSDGTVSDRTRGSAGRLEGRIETGGTDNADLPQKHEKQIPMAKRMDMWVALFP